MSGSVPPGWADEPRLTSAPPKHVAEPPPVIPEVPLLGPSLLAPEGEGRVRHEAPGEREEIGLTEPAVPGSVKAFTGGLALLLLAGLGLGSVSFVQGLFADSQILGWAGAVLTGAGWALAGGAVIAEWRSIRRLGKVTALAQALERLPGAAPPPAALLDWLAGISARLPEASAAADAMARAPDMATARGLWNTALRPALDRAVTTMGRQAGRQAFLGTAIAPSPALDGLVLLVLGLRLLRRIARLHGLRPGLFASLALLRRLVLSAGVTAGVEIAAETAFAQALEAKAAGIAGGAAGAVTAALRMPRLAAAGAKACRPLD
ncbi:DUF697 domain-containing protein [Acetobacteraceae bacterium H6797]|nr:DUF697 domain-containing protein [Acetobacteraceae bacterium H6797]